MEERIPGNVQQLFEQLNRDGVTYCHWKSNEHLMKGLVGDTDLDVLVSPESRDTACDILRRNEYIRVRSHRWNAYDGVEDWIGLDAETAIQTHIHLHFRLITGKMNLKEQYLPWSETMLENRVFLEEPGVWVCDPDMEILILISRILLKRFDFVPIPNNSARFKLSGPDAKELAYLRERTNGERTAVFASEMFGEALGAEMLSLARGDADWENGRMRSVRQKLIRYLANNRKTGRAATFLCSLFRYAVQMTAKKLGRPVNKKKKLDKGALISFLGVDGSGKTTLAKDTQKWLSWKIDCRYVYLGTGQGKSSLLNRLLQRLVASRSSRSMTAQETETKPVDGGGKKKSGLRSGIRKTALNLVALSNMRYKYRAIRRIERWREKGVVVITDRYPQDQFFGINDGLNISETGAAALDVLNGLMAKKERKLLSRILRIQPSFLIKLSIPVEVSRQRKQDSAVDQIERKIRIVEELHYAGAEERTIDSSGNINSTKTAVRNAVWEYLMRTNQS